MLNVCVCARMCECVVSVCIQVCGMCQCIVFITEFACCACAGQCVLKFMLNSCIFFLPIHIHSHEHTLISTPLHFPYLGNCIYNSLACDICNSML